MSFSGRTLLSPFALALVVAAYGCSSHTTTGDASGNPDVEASAESGADKVGSVPEDMLADEKGGENTDANAATGEAATPSTDTAAANADPFGDLKDKEGTQPTDSLAVTETPSTGASESSGQMETYKVKAGDTLMKVAFHLYGDLDRWKDLRDWNKDALKHGNALRKGMKLKYEAPAEAFSPEQLSHSYEIKKGDTLANIADELYGRRAKYKKLQGYNAKLIKNPNRIFAGFTIFYDITAQEVAEAEARRAQRQAQGGGATFAPQAADAAPAPAPMAPAPVPSAIAPPAAPARAGKNVAVTPSAADTSAVPGPGAAAGPPSPTAQ